ncbi:hypothetical protein [Duganella sp. FT27W]|uniref:hypothetical protein n=1 Tax=Duganella sp. FT27W TaxID=2654636 RepID=UPI00128BDFAB|nr:hypothetical protein [Duganella sp. FT27W]MPQ55590.1 hypothetical protein [Duganella sp. FT27W]
MTSHLSRPDEDLRALRVLLPAWRRTPPPYRMLQPWVLMLVLLVAGLLYAMGALFRQPAMLIALFIAAWCALWFVSAGQQNASATAVLAPGLRQRLLRHCFMAGVLGAVLIAVVLAAGFGGRHFAALLLGTGALMCGLLLLSARSALVLLAPLMVVGWLILRRVIDGGREISATVELAWTGAAVLLELAALAWAARLALPRAGDRHMAGRRQASAVVAGPRGPWFANGAGRLARAARALHAVVLRRDIASGNQAALMLHAMGAGRHAGTAMLLALVPTVLMLGTMASGLVDHDLMAEIATAPFMIQCLFMAPALYAAYVLAALGTTGVEQGLYRLAPRAPERSRLNRVWAGIVLRRFLLVWTVSVACLVALAVVSEQGWPANGMRAMQAALWLLSALPLLCNHAAAPKSRGGSSSIIIVAPMSMVLLYYVVPWLDARLSDFNWWWPTLALIIVLAAAMRWQWVRLMAAPPVYPAARIAP